ncbi:TPA: hypothetical protein IAA68_00240 [Candidatus Galligastranaerophilus faecipullorum]|nr:hypothetical protein [Candidatus Galligastranaerophilus faecipullorum]
MDLLTRFLITPRFTRARSNKKTQNIIARKSKNTSIKTTANIPSLYSSTNIPALTARGITNIVLQTQKAKNKYPKKARALSEK